MTLIKCKECGKEYSSNANACPNCGNPTNEDGTAKKKNFGMGARILFSIVIIIAFIVGFAIIWTSIDSLMSKYDTDDETYDTDTVYKVGDTLKCPKFTVKVDKVEIKKKGTMIDSFTAVSDPEWIGVTYTLNNTSDKTIKIYDRKFKLVNTKGELIEKKYVTYKVWGSEPLDSPELTAGGTKTGYVQYANTEDDNSNLKLNIDCDTGIFEDSIIYKVDISQ